MKQNHDFLHVMKSVKDARETSETCSWVTTIEMETIWDVHVSIFDKTYFSTPKWAPNVAVGQGLRSESSNEVFTIRKSVKNYDTPTRQTLISWRFDVWKRWTKGSPDSLLEDPLFGSLAPYEVPEESASHHILKGIRVVTCRNTKNHEKKSWFFAFHEKCQGCPWDIGNMF